MDWVNRTAVVVKPGEPFLEWVRSYPVYETAQEFRRDYSTVILIPVLAPHAVDAYLQTIYARVFEMELGTWHDEKHWPQNRDYRLFREWFDVEIHPMVLDASEEGIEKEPY
jgi:hypothetical protein